MNKILVSVFLIYSISSQAEDKNESKVCRNMMDILRPKNIKPSDCFEKAKDYLHEKSIKQMEGSYQAYFTLAEKVPDHKICLNFLKNVVSSTQKLELEEAQMLFENKTDQSLDQAFYSYDYCDRKRSAIQDQKKDSQKSKSKTAQ